MWFQKHCVLSSIKWMYLLKLVMELDIWYYLVIGGKIKCFAISKTL